MRIIFTFLSSLAITAFLSAQTLQTYGGGYKNSVQLWAGGAGLAYSINYERLLINAPELKLGAEFGAAFYPESSGIIGTWIPLHLNIVLFKGQNHLELGSGVVLTNEFFQEEDFIMTDSDYFLNFRVGYRRQSSNGRYMFRVAVTPFYEPPLRHKNDVFGTSENTFQNIPSRIHPWGGIAFGYAF